MFYSLCPKANRYRQRLRRRELVRDVDLLSYTLSYTNEPLPKNVSSGDFRTSQTRRLKRFARYLHLQLMAWIFAVET